MAKKESKNDIREENISLFLNFSHFLTKKRFFEFVFILQWKTARTKPIMLVKGHIFQKQQSPKRVFSEANQLFRPGVTGHQAGQVHPHYGHLEAVWLDACQTTYGISQPSFAAQNC